MELTIFHTNDIHGNLEVLPQLSSLCRRLRAAARAEGRQVFFWDAGDAADRRREICGATKGAAFYPILNAMGYDLQTMGNAISLPYGPQALAAAAARAEFPILAANCRDGPGPLPAGLQETILIDLHDGHKIGVVGLTSEWEGMYEIFGLHFPDTHQLAEELINDLRRRGATIIAVLSHLGLEADRRLAHGVAGIDLIVGAHSHDLLPRGEQVGETLVAQAGEHGLHLGRVDLTLEPDRGSVLDRRASVIEVPMGEPEDPAVVSAIEAARREVAGLLEQVIGASSVHLDLAHFNECGVGNMAADALRAHMSAQAALIASGHFHAGLPGGRILRRDLNQACFSTANPAVTVVRGAQIHAALERGLDRSLIEMEPGGFRGIPIGTPQVSGMTVEFDPGGGAGDRIRRILIGGRPVDPSAWYSLAHTDAETHPEIGYLTLEPEQRTRTDAPTILPEVMQAYIRENSPLAKPEGPRWLQA